MRLTTLLRRADPLDGIDHQLSARGRAELRALVGPTDSPHEEARRTSGSRPRPQWASAAVAVAALAIGATLLVARVLPQGPIAAVPATSPTATASPGAMAAVGEWMQTSQPPLSGRRDAFTAWVGGRFLVVGGLTDRPCDPGDSCPDGDPLSDGALYDPEGDIWIAISKAPVGLSQAGGGSNPSPKAVVIGETVYMLGLGGRVLAYHPSGDTWATQTTIPGGGMGTLVGSFNNQLVVFPWGQCSGSRTPCTPARTTRYWTYSQGTHEWATHAVDLAMPASTNGAAVVGDRLVISWLTGQDALKAALVDLATDRVTVVPNTPIAAQRPSPVAAGRFAAWPRDHDTTWFLDLATQSWSSVAQPSKAGPITGDTGVWPITVGPLIALNGHLYNPTTRLWSPVPARPIPSRAPVIAGGADAVLACYGYNVASTVYNDTCHLLRPSPASRSTP